jgi:uncharacterized NAD(P)/FAD-binding protein YdhS
MYHKASHVRVVICVPIVNCKGHATAEDMSEKMVQVTFLTIVKKVRLNLGLKIKENMPAISKLILLISHFFVLGLMYFQEKLNAFLVIKFQSQKHMFTLLSTT